MEESWRFFIFIINPRIRAGESVYFCVDYEETQKILICDLFLSARCAKIFGQIWRFCGEFSYLKVMEIFHFFHFSYKKHNSRVLGVFSVFNMLFTIVDNVESVENFHVEIVENSRPNKELEIFSC